ncbi:histidine phosphatase family protein [Isoptericola sp. b441]|uniref:Histidine phosphatase family protein n=1 Tax=Actinotalea lenta TaxID=3064654 RepID=A0ABT9D6E7_9CELL|nr:MULTISPECIES: histidine phosphatase family protein [unclassified Isoptericola]MDO8106409.1 histidine phosphatase family protein [Isoptericola sp. b441]MDO8121886.1 histidine phosphatase family protein [Isoptericola sp. b490]
MGEIVLVRHGETAWSRSGRHTGLTDVPLTELGRRQAADLSARLADLHPDRVVASPLRRASETAELGGLVPEIDERLVEWDYGAYEGLTTPEIRERRGDRWTVFRDGVEPGDTPGESLEQVAARAAAVLADVAPTVDAGGTVVLVAHGHLLRVLASRWLELPPEAGQRLVLDAASISRLGHEHGTTAVLSWNLTPTA